MAHPFRENLEVYGDASESWIRCAQCSHALSPSQGDWKNACVRKLSPPTKAGPLMTDLIGQFVLEQLSCPSCGALFHSDFVESTPDEDQVEREKNLHQALKN